MTWPKIPLSAVTTKVGSGATPRGGKESYHETGVPLIRSQNVRFEGFDRDGLVFLDSQQARDLDGVIVQANDVLLNITGASIGRVTVAPDDLAGARVNQHVCIVRPHPKLLPRFLSHYLASPSVQAFIMAEQSGVTRQALTKAKILDFEVPVPTVDAQQAIVAAIESYFSRLDAATATLERVQRNLERYRASVLKAAVEGRLVPTEAELAKKEGRTYEPASTLLKRIVTERRRRWEETELAKLTAKGKKPIDNKWKAKYEEPAAPDVSGLPELPEGWCWASVGQLISRPLANGRSVPTATEGFPVLRLTAIRSGRVLLSERKVGSWTHDDAAEWLVAFGDFLVVRGNGSRDLVGRGGLVTTTPDPVAFPDTLIRVRIDAAHFEPRLLRLFWDSQVVRDFLQRTAKTTAGIYKINQGDLEKLPLPLPPYAEQARLAGEIERLDSVATVEVSRVDATRIHIARLRQSILKWAFEGRLTSRGSLATGTEPC